jgi:hypothetical protein
VAVTLLAAVTLAPAAAVDDVRRAVKGGWMATGQVAHVPPVLTAELCKLPAACHRQVAHDPVLVTSQLGSENG